MSEEKYKFYCERCKKGMVDGYDMFFDCCICKKNYHEYCQNKDCQICYAPKKSGLFFKPGEERWKKAIDGGILNAIYSTDNQIIRDTLLEELELDDGCCANCYDKLTVENDTKL